MVTIFYYRSLFTHLFVFFLGHVVEYVPSAPNMSSFSLLCTFLILVRIHVFIIILVIFLCSVINDSCVPVLKNLFCENLGFIKQDEMKGLQLFLGQKNIIGPKLNKVLAK